MRDNNRHQFLNITGFSKYPSSSIFSNLCANFDYSVTFYVFSTWKIMKRGLIDCFKNCTVGAGESYNGKIRCLVFITESYNLWSSTQSSVYVVGLWFIQLIVLGQSLRRSTIRQLCIIRFPWCTWLSTSCLSRSIGNQNLVLHVFIVSPWWFSTTVDYYERSRYRKSSGKLSAYFYF